MRPADKNPSRTVWSVIKDYLITDTLYLLALAPLWCGCEPDPTDRSRYVELIYCYSAQIAPDKNTTLEQSFNSAECADTHEYKQSEISGPKFQLGGSELKSVESQTPASSANVDGNRISPQKPPSLRIEIPVLSETTGASNDSAAIKGVSRSEPAAAQAKKPPFYEIILHTGDNCTPCDILKHELKLRGIPFKEHRVKSGTVPVAWIDGVEYVGATKIYKRLDIQRSK